MNGFLGARISEQELLLLICSSVTTGPFDFSVSLKTRQKQKQPPYIELER